MTPLAHALVKELTLPKKRRRIIDPVGLCTKMDDVHCFEVTALDIFLQEDPDKYIENASSLDASLRFLPAPKTWLEAEVGRNEREGLLLIQNGDVVEVYAAINHQNRPIETVLLYHLNLSTLTATYAQTGEIFPDPAGFRKIIILYLALINTPKIIGRRYHQPHAGLQKKLLQHHGGVGHFPLHAWTEIKLEVKPPELADDAPKELWLTGRRALHFCRAHLRIRLGKLEYVKAHWRGDPSIGIKRSRYKVELSDPQFARRLLVAKQ